MKISKTKIKSLLIISQVFLMIFTGIITARANGVTLINTDINMLENTLILDADDTGGDVKLQFGGTLDKYLQWEDATQYFSFNDDIDLQGNEIKNFRIDNLAAAPTCDGTAIGRLYHDTSDSNSYICNGTAWEQIDNPGGGGPFTGIDEETFTINQDGTTGNVYLVFGGDVAQQIYWDDVNENFVISSNLVPAVDGVYDLGTPDLQWNNIYAVNGLTIENGDVSVGEGGFVVSFINGELLDPDGNGYTIEEGDLLEIDLSGNNKVILTQTKNSQPIGVAKNNSAPNETVDVIIIGKGLVKCIGTNIDPGELLQSSLKPGYAAYGVNSTKIIGSAVEACNITDPIEETGTLHAIIHLE